MKKDTTNKDLGKTVYNKEKIAEVEEDDIEDFAPLSENHS